MIETGVNEMKLPQRLSDLLHLRYVAGVRAKEAIPRGMFTFSLVGSPECGAPACLLGWLRATPEGREIECRQGATDKMWRIKEGGDFVNEAGTHYSLFSANMSHTRTDAEELDYRLAWVDQEITRECIKQGLCPEETPKAYEHRLEKQSA